MRTAIRLILLLAAGVLINIAVTMACARWGDHDPRSSSPSIPVQSVPVDAAEYVSDPEYLKWFGPSRKTGLEESTARSLACTRVTYMRWHDNSMAYSRSHDALRFGLPFRSMQYGIRDSWNIAAFPEFSKSRVKGWGGGWPLASEANHSFWGIDTATHVYPLDVLPLGFAANSLIYSVLLLPLIVPLRAMRRRRRLRKGLCPACAYPAGASPVCTECGAALKAAAINKPRA